MLELLCIIAFDLPLKSMATFIKAARMPDRDVRRSVVFFLVANSFAMSTSTVNTLCSTNELTCACAKEVRLVFSIWFYLKSFPLLIQILEHSFVLRTFHFCISIFSFLLLLHLLHMKNAFLLIFHIFKCQILLNWPISVRSSSIWNAWKGVSNYSTSVGNQTKAIAASKWLTWVFYQRKKYYKHFVYKKNVCIHNTFLFNLYSLLN